MRLVRVELNRFRSRRAIALLALGAVLAAALLAGATVYQTRPLTAADRAEAAAQADLSSSESECAKDPVAALGPNATVRDCRDAFGKEASSFYPRKVLDLGAAVDAKQLTRASGLGLALVLAVLMVIAGCTFAGADWSSGSVTNQLLFESRRGRLWLAKAGAVLLGSGVVALVALGGFWLTLVLVAQSRGIDVPGADVSAVAWHVLRAVALCMGAALGGFALTMLFRHTVATLAVLFFYSVAGEIAIGLLPFEGAGRFSVGNNVFGWLASRSSYRDPSFDCDPRCASLQVMTHLEAGIFLGSLLAVAVAVSVLWFRRADV